MALNQNGNITLTSVTTKMILPVIHHDIGFADMNIKEKNTNNTLVITNQIMNIANNMMPNEYLLFMPEPLLLLNYALLVLPVMGLPH